MPASLHSLLAAARPPELYYPALFVFNLFPLHFPITLWGVDAPYGRFGGGGEGRAWGYMNGELVMSAGAGCVGAGCWALCRLGCRGQGGWRGLWS
jgi:hypothetical protein